MYVNVCLPRCCLSLSLDVCVLLCGVVNFMWSALVPEWWKWYFFICLGASECVREPYNVCFNNFTLFSPSRSAFASHAKHFSHVAIRVCLAARIFAFLFCFYPNYFFSVPFTANTMVFVCKIFRPLFFRIYCLRWQQIATNRNFLHGKTAPKWCRFMYSVDESGWCSGDGRNAVGKCFLADEAP